MRRRRDRSAHRLPCYDASGSAKRMHRGHGFDRAAQSLELDGGLGSKMQKATPARAKALTKYVRKVCGAATGRLEDATASSNTAKRDAASRDRAGPRKAPRHVLVRGCVSPRPSMKGSPNKGAYTQQAVTARSDMEMDRNFCYIVVLIKWKPKIMPHEPMVSACLMWWTCANRRFEAWYLERFER